MASDVHVDCEENEATCSK